MLRETIRDEDGVWLVRGERGVPLKSLAQRKYLHANLPDVADEFEKETPKGAVLPEHVGERVKDEAEAMQNLYPHLRKPKHHGR